MSTPKKPRSGGITASELMAELEERRRTDPEYRAELEAIETERAQRVELWRKAEQPIVNDLRDAGFDVTSAWDLHKTAPYPDAVPILLAHLERGGYPDRVMEGMARALAVPEAPYAWETLQDLYLSAEGPDEEDGLAAALATTVTVDHFDQLVTLVHDGSRRSSRVLLLRAIKRVGGEAGREVLRSLTADPLLGAEAQAQLGPRG